MKKEYVNQKIKEQLAIVDKNRLSLEDAQRELAHLYSQLTDYWDERVDSELCQIRDILTNFCQVHSKSFDEMSWFEQAVDPKYSSRHFRVNIKWGSMDLVVKIDLETKRSRYNQIPEHALRDFVVFAEMTHEDLHYKLGVDPAKGVFPRVLKASKIPFEQWTDVESQDINVSNFDLVINHLLHLCKLNFPYYLYEISRHLNEELASVDRLIGEFKNE